MKIDAFTHIITPKYWEALYKRGDERLFWDNWDKVIEGTPALTSLDNRIRVLLFSSFSLVLCREKHLSFSTKVRNSLLVCRGNQ